MKKSINSRSFYQFFVCFAMVGFVRLLAPVSTEAQTTDLGLWTGVGLEKKLSKSFSVNLNTQVRFTDNVSILRAYLAEAGVTYKLTKHWDISVYYRYTGRRKKNDEETGYYYRPYHRFYADAAFDHKVWKLKFAYRLRYQNQFKDDNETGLEADGSYLRNKFEISYPNKSRFTPYVSTDLFHEIGNTFDQMRNKAGVEIEINKHHKVDVFGFTDYQLQGLQENRFLMGLTYKVKF